MFLPWRRRWLRRGSKAGARPLRRSPVRLRLEPFEDRILLATHTWTGAGNGNWSSAANWDNGTQAPVAGDDLVFPSSAVAFASNNDFASDTPFHSLTFTGSGYTLTGAQVQLDVGGVTDNATGDNNINLDFDLPALRTFGVAAGGQMFLGGTISGGPFGGLIKAGAGKLVVTGANSYAGGTTVSQGTLNIRQGSALGVGGAIVNGGAAFELQGGIAVGFQTLTLNGNGIQGAGVLRNVSGINSWGGPIILASDSGMVTEAGRLRLDAAISGPGGLSLLRGGAGSELWLTAANTYSGATTVSSGGTLTLREGGTVLNSPSITVRGATLNLDNFGDGGSADFNRNNRIANGTSISLSGGTFNFLGNDIDDSIQNMGAINLASGFSRITSRDGGGSRAATLTSSRLNRSPGATVSFEGTDLATFTNRILFTTPPVPVGGILPGVTFTDAVNGTELATYSSFGIDGMLYYPLFTVNSFVAGANVVITAPFVSVPDPGVVINSLMFFGGGITVTGAPLTISSGALLAPGIGENINVPRLDFGSTEGIVTTQGSATLTINSAIAGSRGLTKSGTGQLILGNLTPDAGNVYTGLTTLSIWSSS